MRQKAHPCLQYAAALTHQETRPFPTRGKFSILRVNNETFCSDPNPNSNTQVPSAFCFDTVTLQITPYMQKRELAPNKQMYSSQPLSVFRKRHTSVVPNTEFLGPQPSPHLTHKHREPTAGLLWADTGTGLHESLSSPAHGLVGRP